MTQNIQSKKKNNGYHTDIRRQLVALPPFSDINAIKNLWHILHTKIREEKYDQQINSIYAWTILHKY